MRKLLFIFFSIFFQTNSVFFDSNFSSGSECECVANKKDCCSTNNLETFNDLYIFGPLNKLIVSDYFRFYKVNLNRECQFWEDQKKCLMKNCNVDHCTEDELPPAFKNDNEKGYETCSSGYDMFLHGVNTELSEYQQKVVENYPLESEESIDFVDIKDYIEYSQYVDLVKNPERYTGYAGSSSAKVWNSIFLENCLQLKSKISQTGADESCVEFKTSSRLLSGFRTSVAIHLSSRYPIQSTRFDTIWGINYDQLYKRFSPKNTANNGSIWISDVFFAYSLVTRSIIKAKPLLLNIDINTGVIEHDKSTKNVLNEILRVIETVPGTFNEQVMFTDLKNNPELLVAIRTTFKNISRILDCVDCDKCRLWGKVQMQGYATALKILFTPFNNSIQKIISPAVKLNRMEIISLFNLYTRLSTSLNYLGLWRIYIEEHSRLKIEL